MKVSVVILNYNGWDDTSHCLGSVVASAYKPYSIILVDNASKENYCGEIHKNFPDVHIHRNASNRGFAGGSNDGIRFALQQGAEAVFLLNNDAIISDAAISIVSDEMERNVDWGIIGPIINYMDEPSVIRSSGCIFNPPGNGYFFIEQPILPTLGDVSIIPTNIVNGCAMVIKREVFEKIGLLDESYFIVHEESDFCLRALKSGFNNGIIDKVLVWHKGSSSFKREGKEYQRYYDARNLFRLLRSHGQYNGRSRVESYVRYFRYIYYCYCHEIETKNIASATACIEGLVDALVGRKNLRHKRPVFIIPTFFRMFYDCTRWFNSLN
ncbi:MAG: glycosyltransferase family 2 protein [Acidobacteriota bacterium]|jgi:GT2 family glycosyltransferase|nr:glycosyltransferase family 2 protein [Acidobacteriota bacterium]